MTHKEEDLEEDEKKDDTEGALPPGWEKHEGT